MYKIWKCACEKTHISNSFRHHQLDSCPVCGCFVDLEEYCTRITQGVIFLKDLDFNFFDEIIVNMDLQGFSPFIKLKDSKVKWISLETSYKVRDIEDSILEDLRKDFDLNLPKDLNTSKTLKKK
jgi:hypothetical protein